MINQYEYCETYLSYYVALRSKETKVTKHTYLKYINKYILMYYFINV